MTKIVDQFTDTGFKVLYSCISEFDAVNEHVKSASLDFDANEKRAETAFAWPAKRLFPIDSPEQAVMSRVYIEKQAGIPEEVANRCDKALDLFGIKISFSQEKVASDDSDSYLLPEHRRFRVKTAEDVGLAAEAILRNHRKMDVNTKARASTNLAKKAAMLNVALPTDILKFAGVTTCNTSTLCNWLEARRWVTTDPQISYGYQKLAEEVKRLPEHVTNRDDLIKVATVIQELDEAAGITRYYGRTLKDPMQTVFNTDKIAEDTMSLAGRDIPIEALLGVDPEVYKDVLGEDLANEFVSPNGVDAEKMKTILPTVPRDLLQVLLSQLGR